MSKLRRLQELALGINSQETETNKPARAAGTSAAAGASPGSSLRGGRAGMSMSGGAALPPGVKPSAGDADWGSNGGSAHSVTATKRRNRALLYWEVLKAKQAEGGGFALASKPMA